MTDCLKGHVGFIGLGIMGEPMALNLLRHSTPLVVWNRTAERTGAARQAGAIAAESPGEVFARCETVILMMADEGAMDDVLARHSDAFAERVAKRRLVSMGTFRASFSAELAADIRRSGGHYVEAPVSGSRAPAEAGRLVAMLAGEAEQLSAIRPLLAAMCHETFDCGPVPNALRMKLAVNLFLITLVTGLAEATHFADRLGLDLKLFADILGAGPMSSDVSTVKSRKLVDNDFTPQASITDVKKNSALVFEAARESGIASPLLEVCDALYGETLASGFQHLDMVAVVRAIQARTDLGLPQAG